MRVGIVGSRDFADPELVRGFVRQLAEKHPDAVVVSGGARGVDRTAEAEAERAGLGRISFRPSQCDDGFVIEVWEDDVPVNVFDDRVFASYGRAAFARNADIVRESELVVAFWDGVSNGTRHSIRLAQDAGKPVKIIRAEEEKPREKPLVVHCQRDPYDVYIGRGRGGRWGNPFSHKSGTLAQWKVGTVDEAVEAYRHHLHAQVSDGLVSLEDLAALHGKTLGCWCAPGRCHGEVLVRAAAWAHKQLAEAPARPATEWNYLSSPRMTVAVEVEVESRLVKTAPPIARKFVGQPVSNLVRWLERQGDLVAHPL